MALLVGAAGLGPAVAAPPARTTAPTTAPTVAGGPDGGPPLDLPPPANPAGRLRRWDGMPSDVSGGIAYSPGEIIVTDSPFDDHGGDTNPSDGDPSEYVTGPGQGANAAEGTAGDATGGADGDYRYPPGPTYGRNAADIVETRLAADAGAWYLLVRLNTLADPRSTALEARVDGHVLVVHGRTAALGGHRVQVVADPAQALFEVRVPRAVYDPGNGVRQIFVAAGLWDTTADRWYEPVAGRPPFFDLAYVPDEGMDSYWRDRRQSADIAAGTFERDSFAVDFGALARGGCPAGGPCPGYSGPSRGLFTRVFRSGQPLGRGVTPQTRYGQDGGISPPNVYRSPYQPYALYVPRHQSGAMVVLLHFLGGNHMSYPLTSMPQLADWAERLGALVVMPLARGEGGWYEGEAEKDVFEVWRDVATRYRVDPDRVYLAGMSMGGFGTWRLGQLYPDVFARGIIWSGPVVPDTFWPYPAAPVPPSCAPDQRPDCGYNLVDLFGNTRDLPLLVVHGGADELVPSTGAEHWMSLYASTGHASYRYVLYPDRRHETSFPGSTEPWVLRWLSGLPRRQTDPVRVTYRVRRELFQPRFAITYDGAYWVHGLRLAAGAAEGDIDASRTPAPDHASAPADVYGLDDVGPYRLRGSDVTPAPPARGRLWLRLSHLSRAVIDTRRAGWAGDGPRRLSGVTDTACDVVLDADDAGRYTVTGASYTRDRTSLTLHLPRGSFDVTVESGRPRPPRAR